MLRLHWHHLSRSVFRSLFFDVKKKAIQWSYDNSLKSIVAALFRRDASTGVHKMVGTHSSFHVERCTTGKVWFLFKIFLLELAKFWVFQWDWALGYHPTGFWNFPDISWFPKILSLKSFGNSWSNSYYHRYMPSFHLWWKELLVKHQEVSKCYENDCRSYREWNKLMKIHH